MYNLQQMRNSVDIIPNVSLKGLTSTSPPLPGIAPDCILKLTQNNHTIYTQYSIAQSPSSCLQLQVPGSLCQLNNIKQGSATVQAQFNIKQCRHLKIYVNKLDYDIISNKANKLQEQFMNQISFVWNQAYLPLFYDRNNYVKLRVECQGLGRLVQNSQLEVLVQNNGDQLNQRQFVKQEYFTHKLMLLPSCLGTPGNINKVYVLKTHQALTHTDPPQHMQNKKHAKLLTPSTTKTQQKACSYRYEIKYTKKQDSKSVSRIFPCDTNKISIKQQIGYIKSSKNQPLPTSQPNPQKYLLVQIHTIHNLQQLSKLCYKHTHKQPQIHTFSQLKQTQTSAMGSQSQIKSQQSQPNVQCQYKYETHKPMQQQEEVENVVVMSQSLVEAYDIDVGKNVGLVMSKDVGGGQKKIEYLMGKAGFNIRVAVFEKDQNKLAAIRHSFIKDLATQLVHTKTTNILSPCLSPDSVNTTKIYSRIPYLLGAPYPKYSYLTLYQNQNQSQLADPITLNYSKPKHNEKQQKQNKQQKQQIQQQGQQDENETYQEQVKQLVQKLNKFVRVENYFYEDLAKEGLRAKVEMLVLLDGFKNRELHQQFNNRIKNEDKFEQLYKVCYQSEIKTILTFLSHPHSHPHPNLLLTSISNNGKTVLHSILHKHNHPSLYINMSQMDDTSLNISQLNQYLQLVFQHYKGQCIFMDNLDSVCYQVDSGDMHRKQERIAAKILVRNLGRLGKMYRKVCIFTAKNQTNIQEEFNNYQLIKLKNPTRETRLKVIQSFLEKYKQNYNGPNAEQLIQNSESMSFGEFSKYLISGHLEQSQIKKENVLDFSKLAGIKQAKKILRTIVQRPLKYSFIFKRLPIKLSRGVLLYGGSGTGKSAIGQALAGEFKMKFFSVKGSDILSKYIGGSEAAVRDVFQKAMSVSPSIVFFDQFQSIVPRRNASNTGVTDRVVNQFLCYLDGVASVEGVFIVAASSRPELIDPALLRPGRIDTHIFLDHPTKQERQQLFGLYGNSIHFETPLEDILKTTQGYSYSDLIGLINQLRIKKSAKILKQSNLQNQILNSKDFKYIQSKFLQQILSTYRISISVEDKNKQRNMFMKFKNGEAPDIKKQKVVLQ